MVNEDTLSSVLISFIFAHSVYVLNSNTTACMPVPMAAWCAGMIHVVTTSTGDLQSPDCSWQTTCHWDVHTQQQCANALCTAAGYLNGTFLNATNNPCNSEIQSVLGSKWAYVMDENTFSDAMHRYAAKTTALCLANMSQLPGPTTAPTHSAYGEHII